VRPLLLATALSVLGACGSSTVPRDLPSETLTHFVLAERSAPSVIVLVVDDAPTADAAALRATVTAGLRTDLRRAEGPGCDPAAWIPSDVRVFVVLPSAAGNRILGPSDAPALSLHTERRSLADADALVDAIQVVLDGSVAGTTAAFRPIDAVNDVLALVRGDRAPTTVTEQQLVALSPFPDSLHLVVAATRDDQGSSPIDTPRLPADHVAIFPDVAPLLTSRLGTAPVHWPADGAGLAGNGLFGTANDVGTCSRDTHLCASRPIRQRLDGAAECLVIAHQRDATAPCDGQRGWIDPADDDGVRRPRVTSNGGRDERACEVSQLAGAAGVACRETTACEGCGSGYCLTVAPDVAKTCAPLVEIPVGLRFVGKSFHGADAWFEIACALEPDDDAVRSSDLVSGKASWASVRDAGRGEIGPRNALPVPGSPALPASRTLASTSTRSGLIRTALT
jgi:hypothetical protein